MKKRVKIFEYLLLAGLLAGNGHAAAFGLGNIEVQSFLGEPLRANIKLFDVPKALSTGCFKLSSGNDQGSFAPVATNMALRQEADGNATLLIKSYQIQNDPILQLTLVNSCENQMQREYVVLLDPPTSNEAVATDFTQVTDEPEIQAAPAVRNVSPAPKQLLANEVSTHPQTIPLNPVATPKKARKSSGNSENYQAVPVAPTQSQPPPKPGKTNNDEPLLVVSGGGYTRSDLLDSPLKLQLSTTLGEWPVNAGEAPLTANDVSDEITAMANKLAYLETQIAALQKRNIELEASQAKAAVSRTEENAFAWTTWALYGLTALLLAILVAAARWYRHRIRVRQMAADAALWDDVSPAGSDPQVLEEDFMGAGAPSITIEETAGPAAPVAVNTGKSNLQPVQAASYSAQPQGAEINEDILEQAEVFVAHGRTALAIILLQDYLRDAPDASPAPWLMLLDLLKREGQQDEYEETCKECKNHFNVAIEDFSEPPVKDSSSLEDYPRVKERLEQVWGTSDAVTFLDDLIYNRRAEARQGFERNAYLDILLLRSIANDLNFSSPAKTRASVIPITSKKSSAVQDPGFSPDQTVTETPKKEPDEGYFPYEPERRRSSADKSEPLDFDIEFKR